jgi:protein-tyrosine phosphatase
MRPIGTEPLWIGHAGDMRDPRAILSAGIEAVIELADNEPFANLPRELIRLRFPLSDGGENPAWLLRLATNSLAALIQARVPTLVCCANGMSRSVSIAAAGLSRARGIPLDAALQDIARNGPADVSPALLGQLRRAFEEITLRFDFSYSSEAKPAPGG